MKIPKTTMTLQANLWDSFTLMAKEWGIALKQAESIDNPVKIAEARGVLRGCKTILSTLREGMNDEILDTLEDLDL